MKTKMTPQAHTPTPWRFKLSVDDAQKYVYAAEVLGADQRRVYLRKKYFGEGITSDQLSVDAAFIVRAVNSHEELVTRMHTLVASLDSVLANTESHKDAFGGSRHSIMRMLRNDIALGKEAIAKAEGK